MTLLPETEEPTAADVVAVERAEPPHATLVDTEGRLLRLYPQPGGALLLLLETGRGDQPRMLDRFQASALVEAVKALGDA